MKDRPEPTLIDFLVAAINPVLVMLLLGSLLFFLVEVFYQGQYSGRLHVVLALFVMATVLIARIAIEEDTARAIAFGAPLAIVTYLALSRFVVFQGPLAGLSPFLNAALMALIWWAAGRLTWDAAGIAEGEQPLETGLWEAARGKVFSFLSRKTSTETSAGHSSGGHAGESYGTPPRPPNKTGSRSPLRKGR